MLPAWPVCFPISNRRNSFGSESEMRRDCKIGFGIWRKRIRPDNDFQDNPDLLWRSREVSRSVFLPPTWWGSVDRISSESESDPRLGLRPLFRRPWGLRTRRSWNFWRFGCRTSRNRFKLNWQMQWIIDNSLLNWKFHFLKTIIVISIATKQSW